MIIGHLPVGYLATKFAAARWKKEQAGTKLFMAAGLLGSVVPDLDMFYFHLVDNRQQHHHTYWPHIPLYWAGLLLLAYLSFRFFGKKQWIPLLGVFAANICLHLFADSIVGDIWWLAPIIDKPFALFTVPALFKPWWINFLLHWSFGLEILALAGALHVWRRGRLDKVPGGAAAKAHGRVPIYPDRSQT